MILVPRRSAVFIRSFFIYNLKQLEVSFWREWRSLESCWADGRDGSFCCLQPAASQHWGESQEPWQLERRAPSSQHGDEVEDSPVPGPLSLVWFLQEQLWSRTSSSSQPLAPLARRREPALGMEPAVPKGLPSLTRPAPSPPIHRFKNSSWGSFFIWKASG